MQNIRVGATIASLMNEMSTRGRDTKLPPGTEAESGLPENVVGWLAEQYSIPSHGCEVRRDIVAALTEVTGVTELAVIPTLIAALDDECADIRQLAARGLARYGQHALGALLDSITQRCHGDCFYPAAHHALYLLQYHAPLRDRQAISMVLAAVAGPEPAVHAPTVASQALQG